ncbi:MULTISPECIES: flavodoxin family protein [Dehalococcoides]|jgi:multimeric flavodoxin WrbA|uniref:flavodoxin family protein n=1 Tax=Dehalococcoides TaxID=61434 RepID=UPI0003C86A1A|nr:MULTISPECIES: flavodoxin family protein [Dehalococcoides]AHB13853.1 NADPH-dependent FMN reductase [Dehalococcoides mccartyi GY50]AII58210.1 flavodoxin [Dehalococcoides mccartyi CG1]APH12788.1 flavodoxin [Dehalococcoides mccartyi]QYY57787.1 flavodoxin family protein [Dehalococcoides mccartyi]BAQ34977.1 putative iron-sulfur flavoprotein [Dehalococcoides sp. UCH007]
MKVLAVMGSPRSQGNTAFLLDEVLSELEKEGIETRKIDISQANIKPCLGHDNCAGYKRCPQNDDMDAIFNEMREADGFIVATPVYYYNVTAQLKAFIDRHYFLYKHDISLEFKAVGVVILAEEQGLDDTLNTLVQYLDSSFKVKAHELVVLTGYAAREGDAKTNTELISLARDMGQTLAASLKGVS